MVHSEAVARACEVDSSDSVDVISRVSLFCDSTGRLSTNGQRMPALGLLQIQIWAQFGPHPVVANYTSVLTLTQGMRLHLCSY